MDTVLIVWNWMVEHSFELWFGFWVIIGIALAWLLAGIDFDYFDDDDPPGGTSDSEWAAIITCCT